MYERGCESGVRRDEVCDVSAGQVRDAFGGEFILINRKIRFEDKGLIVDSVVREG